MLNQHILFGAFKKSKKIDKLFRICWPNSGLIFQKGAYLKDIFIGNKVAE